MAGPIEMPFGVWTRGRTKELTYYMRVQVPNFEGEKVAAHCKV